jgi:hypothetical protein
MARLYGKISFRMASNTIIEQLNKLIQDSAPRRGILFGNTLFPHYQAAALPLC